MVAMSISFAVEASRTQRTSNLFFLINSIKNTELYPSEMEPDLMRYEQAAYPSAM